MIIKNITFIARVVDAARKCRNLHNERDSARRKRSLALDDSDVIAARNELNIAVDALDEAEAPHYPLGGETALSGGAVLGDTSSEKPLAHSPKCPTPDKLPLTGLDGFRVLLMEAIHPELQGEDSTYELDRRTGQIAVRFNGHDCWIQVHNGIAPFMLGEVSK